MTSPILTIAYPTFNRRDEIAARLGALFDDTDRLPDGVDVLVIDNASEDGTWQMLEGLTPIEGLRIERNAVNIGFAGNIYRVINECRAAYVMLCSDEDEIVIPELVRFLAFLRTERPSFVSPQMFLVRNGKHSLYRGRRAVGPVAPSDFRSSSFYMSGLVYSVPVARRESERITEEVRSSPAGVIYPQVVLTARLLLVGESCLWYDAPLAAKRAQLPTAIDDPLHGGYAGLASRWSQFLAIEEFLRQAYESATDAGDCVDGETAKQMLAGHRSTLFRVVRGSIRHERPDMLHVFDHGARFHPLARGIDKLKRLLVRLMPVRRRRARERPGR